MKISMRSTMLAGLIVLAGGSGAMADTLTMTFDGVSPKATVKYSLNGERYRTVRPGRFNWTTAGGQTVHTFCTQLQEYISEGNTVTYDRVSAAEVPDAPPVPMGSIRATVMEDLFNRYHSTAIFGGAVQAAAFQMLVWEISHEPLNGATTATEYQATLGLTTGNLTFIAVGKDQNSQPAIDLATTWLGTLGGVNHDTWLQMAGLQGLTHSKKQDQLIVVPLPAPMAMAGLGLVGAVVVRRRLRR